MTKLSLFAVLCCFLATTAFANPLFQRVSSFTKERADVSYRLPNNSVPLSYDVKLWTRVDKEDFDFTGEVEIKLKITQETDKVTIHHRQLTILTTNVSCNAENLKDVTFEYDPVTEHMVFNLEKEYEPDTECKLIITYKGTLRTDNGGFYRSSYVDANGKTKWLATTQFESTDARHAFPCYDEPGLRATFDIQITYGGEGYHAISNMEIADILEHEDGTTTTTFMTTPSVQPYLIAFVVSDFTFVELVEKDKVPQKLFARPAAIDAKEGEFGVKTGVEILTEQGKYFGIEYKLSKMDQISIPDFQAGAMENWGLVTYREELLLYNKEYHALNTKRRIAGIIAHEFAHQWFGNLVAPEWWSYLWLNEGFATLYQYTTINTLYPDFDAMGFFIFENLQDAMESDALETKRPMTHYVENPIAVRNLFDDIAYAKSGSVLRMVQHAMTDALFAKGLNSYLKENSFQAANPDHLSAGLQTATDGATHIPKEIKMKDFMDSWSTKAGYPLVEVERTDDNKLILTQKRFTFKVGDESKETWVVPINMASATEAKFDDTKPQYWLTGKTLTIEPAKENATWTTDDWIVFNKQETGFYRVNYDEKLWAQIVAKLKTDKFEDIHAFNRAQLVDDLLNLARANIKDYPSVFRLMEYMKQEKHFVPWASASSGLRYLQRQLLGSPSYNHFNRFVQEMVSPLFANLTSHDGGENEKLADKHARTIAIDWACRTNDAKCISDTKDRVKQVLDDDDKEIESDVRYIVYCSGLREANVEDYDAMMKRLEKQQDQDLRTTYINAMGCLQNSDIQKTYLNSSISDDSPVKYRIQERNRVLQGVYASGQTGLENAMAFIKDHHKEIEAKYNPPSPVKTNVITMAERVTSTELNVQFTELMDELTKEGYFTEEEKEKVLETPKENIEWSAKHETEIRSFFADYYKDGATTNIVSTFFLGMLLVMGYLLQ